MMPTPFVTTGVQLTKSVEDSTTQGWLVAGDAKTKLEFGAFALLARTAVAWTVGVKSNESEKAPPKSDQVVTPME